MNTRTEPRKRAPLSSAQLEKRQILTQTFPTTGKVRVSQCAAFLGIGESTFWSLVKVGRIEQPMRFGKRLSVWDAAYIQRLAKQGIPPILGE
ncbi:MAG: hypothetical protein WBP46_14945 [Thiolinea sp.]